MKKQRNSLWSRLAWLTALVCGFVFGLLCIAQQHEIVLENPAKQQLELTFSHGTDQLAGTLLLPAGQGPFPVVLLVHGDGPQTRDLERYTQIIKAYLAAGIACFSWDKPGTGASDGDWLQQSMQQRAAETQAAMQMLAQRADIQPHNIGLLGFSQGGWVLPQVAALPLQPAFLITVGAALDWRAQSDYFTRQRLSRAGFSAAAIASVIAWQQQAPQPAVSLSYADYQRQYAQYVSQLPPPAGADSAPLPAGRYQFVALNIDANSSAQLAALQVPLLAVWGQDDLNVDAQANAQAFGRLLHGKPAAHYQVVVLPQADHTMLDSARFAQQLPQEWSWWMTVQYFLLADQAFAPQFLPLLVDWSKQQLKP